jgi:GTP cyclohydrolase II
MTDREAEPAARRRAIAADRAAGELRRGRPVLVAGSTAAAAAVAAEQADDRLLGELRGWAAEAPVVALTARRAAVLHIPPTGYDTVLVPLEPRMDAGLVRHLADPTADLARPLEGPYARIKAPPPDYAAAAVALAKRARLLPAAVLAPVADPAGLAASADLLTVSAADILAAGGIAARDLHLVTSARVPLAGAENARVVAFRPADGTTEHLAIVVGEPPTAEPVLARLHSECFTGDLLGSLRCDCGQQLRGALALMAERGGGVLLYLAQEGRGIGLINKLRAYRLQDEGFDTIEANERLGFEADERLFEAAAEMLRELGYARVRLLTNNPDKVAALGRLGIEVVERVGHAFPASNHNEAYLATKRRRSGHYL